MRRLQLLAAERLQSAWLARVHGDAVVGRASRSTGTRECRIPCARLAQCWMGMSCSQSGSPLQGVGLGASGLLQSGVEGRKPRSGPPTLSGCCLGGGRSSFPQLSWGQEALRLNGVSGGQPPAPCQQRCRHPQPKGTPQGPFPLSSGSCWPWNGKEGGCWCPPRAPPLHRGCQGKQHFVQALEWLC